MVRIKKMKFGVIVRNFALLGLVVFAIASCAVRPERLDSESISSFAQVNLSNVTAGQEPIVDTISLYDAMARAVKYNLDFHVEMYNEILKSNELAIARLGALPSLVANSDYNGRNNDAGGTTAVLRSDRSRFNGDITLSWNILDFGLSYIRAQQVADGILIARERRRKIINRIIGNVRSAYWRAVSADRLIAGLRRLTVRVRGAIRDSEALQKEGTSSPLTALTYQRELIEIQQQINGLQLELSVAKSQLAALMNISPSQNFRLSTNKIGVGLSRLRISADEMIFTAMENRPEILDLQYNLRINDKEAKSALLELLPSANVFAGANIDTDSFLLNSNWVGWGAKVSWNLMRVFKYPAKKRLIAAKDDLLKQRALAVTMAIITQVYVGRAQYRHSRKVYFTSAKHLRVQRGILRQIRESAAADQASEQTLIREEMNTLASRAKRDIAFADLQNAYANIYTTMGLDPYTSDTLLTKNVSAISASLKSLWIERGVRSGTLRLRKRLSISERSGVSSNSGKLVISKSRTEPKTEKNFVAKLSSVSQTSDEDEEIVKPKPGFFGRLAENRRRRIATFQSKELKATSEANNTAALKIKPALGASLAVPLIKPETAKRPGILSRLSARRKQRIAEKNAKKIKAKPTTANKNDVEPVTVPENTEKPVAKKQVKLRFFWAFDCAAEKTKAG